VLVGGRSSVVDGPEFNLWLWQEIHAPPKPVRNCPGVHRASCSGWRVSFRG